MKGDATINVKVSRFLAQQDVGRNINSLEGTDMALLERLESEDYRTAGDAAKALGYLGFPEVEPKLIAALAPDNGWRQVNACSPREVGNRSRASSNWRNWPTMPVTQAR